MRTTGSGPIRPDATVVHQSGPYFGDWWFGGSNELVAATDWLSADTYTSREGLSFALKLSNSLSRTRPAELINTWTAPAIFEHVVTRTADEMTPWPASPSRTTAHSASSTRSTPRRDRGPELPDDGANLRRGAPAGTAPRRPDAARDRDLPQLPRHVRQAESGHTVSELRYPDEREEFGPSRSEPPYGGDPAGGALQAEHCRSGW